MSEARIELDAAEFRTIALAVLPFVDEDNPVQRLSGVRFAVAVADDGAVYAEGVTDVGGAHCRAARTRHADPAFDRVLPFQQVEQLLEFVEKCRGTGAVHLLERGDDRVQASINTGNGLVSWLTATLPGDGFPLQAGVLRRAVVEDRAGVETLTVRSAVLGRLRASLATVEQPAVIHPGRRHHLAVAGDQLVVVVGAHLGLEAEKQRRFQTVAPTTGLDTWRARLAPDEQPVDVEDDVALAPVHTLHH